MILLREIQEQDLPELERFSQIPGFLNLPEDKDQLRDQIRKSIQSFRGEIKNLPDTKYMFIAVDTVQGRVVGTSMIAGQHGTEKSPHFYFEIGKEQKMSESLNTGFIHGTLELKIDMDGPSEIGGLVIDPEFRNTAERVGRQISFVRFLYLGMHKERFKKKLIAELLPPLNKRGRSPLWEAIGRRFTNMDYWEADLLSRGNKEFVFSLFPSGKIYTTFLPAEARNAIGKVGRDTEPVLHMLQKIGFKYRQHVDPFDGGPHLWADVKEIAPIKKMGNYRLTDTASGEPEQGLLCASEQKAGVFRALSVEVVRARDAIAVQKPDVAELEKHLGVRRGDSVVFMPYY